MSDINITNSKLLRKINEVKYPLPVKAWSDMERCLPTFPTDLLILILQSLKFEVQTALDINACLNDLDLEQANQIEIKNEFYFPTELMENIVYYFDGITLLKYRSLSKTCSEIVKSVSRHRKVWKKNCLADIPRKYFYDLLNRHFHGISVDFISEIQYEQLYNYWLQWKFSNLKLIKLGRRNFVGYSQIKNIVAHKFEVMVLFITSSVVLLKLEKTDDEFHDFAIIEVKMEGLRNIPIKTVIVNPLKTSTIGSRTQNFTLMTHTSQSNICHLPGHEQHPNNGMVNCRILCALDNNFHINTCCWVRNRCYGYRATQTVVHECPYSLCDTMFVSVIHGVIVSRIATNSVIIHNIYKNSCEKITSWLNTKYIQATAVRIYIDILFIGTNNGYLLAYRLDCWDDLKNLKKKNLLLEAKLDIGHIIQLEITDFNNFKAIVVSSASSVFWIKLDLN